MTKYKLSKTVLCIVLALMCALFPNPSRAADNERPIRLYAIAETGPIGRVYSLGAFIIDGRMAIGQTEIWGGELIQTSPGSSVNVEIDLVGRVTLKNEAVARLAATAARRNESGAHRLVVASLFEGDMTVKLQPGGSAYIESCGSEFTASGGACFDIKARNGRVVLDSVIGSVEVQTSRRPPTIKARTVRVDPNRTAVPVATTPLQRKTGQSAQVSTQWLKYYEGSRTSGQSFSSAPRLVQAGYQTTSQTTQTEPAAFRRVAFRLEPPTLGTLTPAEKPTDDQGVVTVDFQAGSVQARGFIVADMVPDSGDPAGTTYEPYRRPVSVTRAFWTRTKLFIAAGALAVVTCAVACGPGNKPLQQAPPPVIP
jgi:hypothetical protein